MFGCCAFCVLCLFLCAFVMFNCCCCCFCLLVAFVSLLLLLFVCCLSIHLHVVVVFVPYLLSVFRLTCVGFLCYLVRYVFCVLFLRVWFGSCAFVVCWCLVLKTKLLFCVCACVCSS